MERWLDMPDDSNFVGTSQLSNVYRGHPDTTDQDDVGGQKSFGVGKKSRHCLALPIDFSGERRPPQ